jgi:hypothetical protein
MKWRQVLRDWAVMRSRQAGQQIERIAAHGYEKARAAGRRLAVQVTAVQKAARLNGKLTRRSLESVRQRAHDRGSDREFRDAYVARATQHQPAAQPPEPDGPQVTAAPEPPDPRFGPAEPVIHADRLRPLRFAPEARASDRSRMPPGHGRRVARGDFASPQEAREAADAWRDGASFSDYLAMGTGADREAGG